MQEKIFQMLLNKDELTWQSLLYDLVREEKMNPWDINVSTLTQRFIEMIKNMQKMDLMISGKVVLAAAILLKIKSNRLLGQDLTNLDRLFAQSEGEEDFSDDFMQMLEAEAKGEETPLRLIPRTPQPRKRKVSIFDLINALDKALEVKKRRVERYIPDVEMQIPTKKVDITKMIKDIYQKINTHFSENGDKTLTFSQLVTSENKLDKVYAFIPLLHLANHDQRKIDLEQKEHFGEIEITMPKKE